MDIKTPWVCSYHFTPKPARSLLQAKEVLMSINKLRRTLYRVARILGDVQALSSSDPKKVARRAGRRATGRAAGKLLRKLIK
jgi:hypothetical protein